MEIALLIGVFGLGLYAIAAYQERNHSKKHKKR
jgi:hypothetical protein